MKFMIIVCLCMQFSFYKIFFMLASSFHASMTADVLQSLLGENFAMISGTSMAAPHIAGLAALIKQKFPKFSPSAIASAFSTTATLYDKQGGPIKAQRAYSNPDASQSPATPFDMGSGFVNATAALDPGLIFDSSKFFFLFSFWLQVAIVHTMQLQVWD